MVRNLAHKATAILRPTCALPYLGMQLSAAVSGQTSCAQIRSSLGSSTDLTWAELWCAAHFLPFLHAQAAADITQRLPHR